MSALNWIQHLEDERDKADIDGNYAGFKKLTDEISATIAGKYGISKRSATQEEQITIIHSITRTRHRFMGQRNMLHDRYLGYDRAKTNSLLQTESLFKNHMAAVLAVDAMVMKAMNDDDFEELWRQENADKTASTVFVAGVIDHAKGHEKKEVLEPLQPHLQRFLQARHDVIYIANDVFSVFAPKMTLQRIYNDMMVSGGVYKGWAIHNADAFSKVVLLTMEEKEQFPHLENALNADLIQRLTKTDCISAIYPFSERASSTSYEIYTKLGIKADEMLIEYIYDACSSLGKVATTVKGSGPIHLYLSRPVAPKLEKIIKRRYGVIPIPIILDKFKYVMALEEEASSSLIKEAAERGMPEALNKYAGYLSVGMVGIEKNILMALSVCRDAAALGSKCAISNFPHLLIASCVRLFNGTDGVAQNIPAAIELLDFLRETRESADLCNDDVYFRNLFSAALHNCADALHNCADTSFQGTDDGVKKNPFKALDLLREAAGLGNELSIRKLPGAISYYANMLFNGTEDIEKNVPQSIEMMREAVSLGDAYAIRNLPVFLHNYSVMLTSGQNGIDKDIFRGIEVCREAARLGQVASIRDLPISIYDYSIKLFYGRDGIERDISRSIEFMRETESLGYERAIRGLQCLLNDYAVMLHNGVNEVVKDIPKSIEFCREASRLGNIEARENLPAFLHNYGLMLLRGECGIIRDIAGSLRIMRESAILGNEGAKRCLSDYSVWLAQGSNGFERDVVRAVEVCEESGVFGKDNLPIFLHGYSCLLFEGVDGMDQNMSEGIKICRKVSGLDEGNMGVEIARKTLPRFLYDYAVVLFYGQNVEAQNIPKSIELCKESASLGNPAAIRNLQMMLASLNR